MVVYDFSSLVLTVTHNCLKNGSVLQPKIFARNSAKPSMLLRNTIDYTVFITGRLLWK